MPNSVKLFIDPAMLPAPKNTNGVLGEKCNNCGGFGYTMGLNGKTLNCGDCEETGIKLPTRRELQTQISDIKKDLFDLKKALINTLKMNGKSLKEMQN
jgi:hypothetical protein